MKALLLLVGASLSAAAFGTPAQAQNYPWCAYYSDDMGGTNCGFSTYAQCMATISGIGGICQPNTQYAPPAGARRQRSAN